MTASWADTTTRTIRQTRLTLAGASAGLSGAVVVASITASVYAARPWPGGRKRWRQLRMPTRRLSLRKGLLAVPLYLFAVGVGHSALALIWYDRTTGLPRDGQAFSGTFVLGVGLVLIAIITVLVALPFDRTRLALVRGSVAALVVATSVVGYTASRGYLLGGLTGGSPCITEATGPGCAPGAGTYIADAQPHAFVILLGIVAAYALAHIAARVQERR